MLVASPNKMRARGKVEMKYDEDFYVVIHGKQDRLEKVKGRTYEKDKRLFIQREENKVSLNDKRTGLYVVFARTFKALERKYHEKLGLYNHIYMKESYRRLEQHFNDLKKQSS